MYPHRLHVSTHPSRQVLNQLLTSDPSYSHTVSKCLVICKVASLGGLIHGAHQLNESCQSGWHVVSNEQLGRSVSRHYLVNTSDSKRRKTRLATPWDAASCFRTKLRHPTVPFTCNPQLWRGVVYARGEPRRPPSIALPLSWICVLWWTASNPVMPRRCSTLVFVA